MKYSRRWRWENTWLVFSVIALIILPWLLTAVSVPRLTELLWHSPGHVLVYPLVFGVVWGIAQTTLGIGISAVGMALAFTVVAGLACLSGSLVPLLTLDPGELFRPRGILLLISMPILFLGLFFYGKAGRRREKEQPGQAAHTGINYSFGVGLGICIFTGIIAASWNMGFAFSGSLIQRGIDLGASSLTAPYVVWALIFTAGFTPNLLYCAYLLSRNRTWGLFGAAGSVKETVLALVMAVLWLSGVIVYGIGATVVGKYGTSIGFALFVAAQILSSNMMGVLTGEWKATSPKTRRILAGAVVLTIISVVVLNLGGLY